MPAPVIGITVDNHDQTAAEGKYDSPISYSRRVMAAEGVPILLPHEPSLAKAYAHQCDGLILTGGTDPDTTDFGAPLHPKARPMNPRRQAFELALLDACRNKHPDKPVLGICLGMQLMALHGGGRLHQYLPDVLSTWQLHTGDHRHTVMVCRDVSVLTSGGRDGDDLMVVSHHRQAVSNAGALRVVAKAPDGVVEAIDDPGRRFYLGVQWHPERGGDGDLNRGLIDRLVRACRGPTGSPLT